MTVVAPILFNYTYLNCSLAEPFVRIGREKWKERKESCHSSTWHNSSKMKSYSSSLFFFLSFFSVSKMNMFTFRCSAVTHARCTGNHRNQLNRFRLCSSFCFVLLKKGFDVQTTNIHNKRWYGGGGGAAGATEKPPAPMWGKKGWKAMLYDEEQHIKNRKKWKYILPERKTRRKHELICFLWSSKQKQTFTVVRMEGKYLYRTRVAELGGENGGPRPRHRRWEIKEVNLRFI